jgi:serine---pyruvate transaminase
MIKKRLYTPGPTPVPEKIMLTMAEPMIHHRHPEFQEILTSVNENLKYLFQTKNGVMTLTSSGTGAMEASVANVLSKGDTAVYVNGGKFGERWGELLNAYGCKAVEIATEWGIPVSPEQVVDVVKNHPETKAVYLTHSETSTGTATDIKTIAELIHAHNNDIAVIVDGITSVGAMEIKMDEWDLDIVVTGSQKGLMIPPGLSHIALSERAWGLVDRSDLPSYYFDLKAAKKALEQNDTPWTPAVTLFIGLKEALQALREEGIENVWARHQKLADAIREGCKALGLKLLSSSPSNALTAVYVPEGVEFKKFNTVLKQKYGITVAGGQGHLKGKIFRISHLGYYDELDMMTMMAALERTLSEVGAEIKLGAGLTAAQEVLIN